VDEVFANFHWAPLAHFAQIFLRNVTNLPVNVPLPLFLNSTVIGQSLATSSRICAVSSDLDHVAPTHALIHLSGSSSSVTYAVGAAPDGLIDL
jgi:hypothetical protein